MKIQQIVSIEVFSRRSMRKPEDFFARLMLHHDMLPRIRPTKWGWWEPVSEAWDISDLQKFIPDDQGGEADNVIWTRTHKPKCQGNLSTAYVPQPGHFGIHGSEWMHCEQSQFEAQPMINYIQQSVVRLDCDVAFIHTVAEQEKNVREIESRYEGAFINTKYLGFATHTLRHWLPELPWAVVFGQAYVRLFGLDRLLTAPAHVVKKLSDEAVYLQLSPKLDDLLEDYESVNRVREAVKDHLGRDVFFDRSKAYPLRSPVNETGIYTGEEIRNFKPPPPIGTVFRVPDFNLISDD